MWLPPFKIIKGLFSNLGEFSLPDGSDYEGPYYKTSDGAYYTGAEPNKDQMDLTPSLDIVSDQDKFIDHHNDLYQPKTELVYPNPKDYKKGYFIRYYVEDTRIGKVVETDEQGYRRYSKELYIKGVEVKWILEKPLKDIFMSGFLYKGGATRNIENVNAVLAEMPNLKSYITDYGQFIDIESDVEGYKFEELPVEEQERLIKQVRPNLQEAPLKRKVPRFKKVELVKMKEKSNLYTPGGRFKIKGSNKEYVGFYHIHPSKGAMEGAIHSDEFHNQLIPIGSTIDLEAAEPTIIDTTTNVGVAGGSSQVSPTYSSPSSGGSSGGGGGGSY